ncbi:MAG: hypothetical protein RIS29_1916 [Bacteroidota bacterium]|jgi:hypothetical protein
MFKNKFSLLFLVAISLSQFSGAQNNTNSPYTRYGYGELSSATSGEQKAMGGVSIGARRKTSINTVNPASYSSVDSMTFMFDVGATGLLSRFSNTTGVTNKFTANLDYITMQFPVAKHVGFSAGLLPYSYAGYNYSVNLYEKTKYPTIPDFDTIFYRNSFNGYGTISQVYTGLGVDLFNHLSVGANVYYMFGSLYNTRSLRDKSSSDSTLVVSSTDVGDFRLRYGLQYHNTFAKKHDLNVGVVYEQKSNLKALFTESDYGVLTQYPDTLDGDRSFQLPQMFGLGLYYTYDKRLSLGVDYSLQKWGSALYRGDYSLLKDCSKLAVGAEYIPNSRGRYLTQRMSYRLGFNMSDPYYRLDNSSSMKNYNVSFGLGLPLYNAATNAITMLNASVEYGKVGATDVLREDYLKFTLNVVFNEHWFFKRKL